MNEVDAAHVKLAELLRHPEDLEKIPALKAEFTRKKAAVDSQLKLGLKEQLEITSAGMTSLGDGQRTVTAIRDELAAIDRLCAEAGAVVRDFPHVNLVAATHRNFEQVQRMKADIIAFEKSLVELEELLRIDEEDLENLPNLLAVHYGLTKLRDIRDEAVAQAKGSPDGDVAAELMENLRLDGGSTLKDHFNRLDNAVEWFDEHVGEACMRLIELVQSGNHGLVVRLALVIEEEEKSDKKVRALQEAQREYKELAARFKSIATGPKELRGYKEKFLKAIELQAEAQLVETNNIFLEDPNKLEKSVRWYFNDLNTVKLGMVSLMPRKWRIFRTYVATYHGRMRHWLVSRIEDPEIRPPHMLAIVHWVDKYYAKMAKLGAPEDALTPHLIDERGAELVREYRQLIVKAVDEWMSRMGSTDEADLAARKKTALLTDDLGCFRTKTLGDMWRMLHEQLAVAGTSNRTDVVEGVVDAMFRALRSRQSMWERLVDGELTRYTANPEQGEGLQLLQDWLVAIANDQISCIDDGDDESTIAYLSRLTNEMKTLVSEDAVNTVTAQTDALRDGYVDLGTHCIVVFAALVFAVDFRALMPTFFTQDWYTRKGMGQAISTFEDYLDDYAGVLHPSLRDILVEELSDALLARYLGAVRNKGVRFRRADPFVAKIKDDVVAVFDFFSRFDDAFPAIRDKWRVVDRMVRLLEADKPDVLAHFEEFKRENWDLNMTWVEAVLRARDDYDRSLLNSVKQKSAEMYVERGPETIMSKVK